MQLHDLCSQHVQPCAKACQKGAASCTLMTSCSAAIRVLHIIMKIYCSGCRSLLPRSRQPREAAGARAPRGSCCRMTPHSFRTVGCAAGRIQTMKCWFWLMLTT